MYVTGSHVFWYSLNLKMTFFFVTLPNLTLLYHCLFSIFVKRFKFLHGLFRTMIMDSTMYKDSIVFQNESKQDKKAKKSLLAYESQFQAYKLRVSASIAELKLDNEADGTMITTSNIRENVWIMNFVSYGFWDKEIIKTPSCFKILKQIIERTKKRVYLKGIQSSGDDWWCLLIHYWLNEIYTTSVMYVLPQK